MDSNVTGRASGRRKIMPSPGIAGPKSSTTAAAPERRPDPIVLPAALDRSRIIGVDQAAELLNFSIAHVRRLYRTGKMPKPVSIGGGKLGWKAGVLLDFIDGVSGAA